MAKRGRKRQRYDEERICQNKRCGRKFTFHYAGLESNPRGKGLFCSKRCSDLTMADNFREQIRREREIRKMKEEGYLV